MTTLESLQAECREATENRLKQLLKPATFSSDGPVKDFEFWYNKAGVARIASEISSFQSKWGERFYEEGFDAGGHTVGGTGRTMYEKGQSDMVEKAVKEIEKLNMAEFTTGGFRRRVLSILESLK